jgi:hypothetical protein
MIIHKPTTKLSFLQRVKYRLSRKHKQVPEELKQAIDDCSSVQQLLNLLFSIDFIMNEATLDAFDKRFDELDPSGNPIY